MPNQPNVAAELERVTAERDQAWRDALSWRRRAEALEDAVKDVTAEHYEMHEHAQPGPCGCLGCRAWRAVDEVAW